MAGSDFAVLQQAITDLTAQVTRTQGVEASAKALILGFSQQIQTAVAQALADDDAADQGSIAAAKAAIDATTQAFAASADDLGTAIGAGPAPPTPKAR